MLAAPSATISWLVSTCSPRRAARLRDTVAGVGERHERHARGRDEQRRRVVEAHVGEARAGKPDGIAPDH